VAKNKHAVALRKLYRTPTEESRVASRLNGAHGGRPRKYALLMRGPVALLVQRTDDGHAEVALPYDRAASRAYRRLLDERAR